jgi:hypothetical protein
MRRACTEDGLWERLAAGITPPPDASAMAAAFLEVYAAPAGSGEILAA